jgi:hypothetical protein
MGREVFDSHRSRVTKGRLHAASAIIVRDVAECAAPIAFEGYNVILDDCRLM